MGEHGGRFEVQRTDGALVLHDPGARAVTRFAYLAPHAAFALFPAVLLATGAETTSLWPWGVFVGLGLTTSASDFVHGLRHHVFATPPYRRIQRTLSIEVNSVTGGPRDAALRPALRIDGRPVELGEAPRVAITRSGARHHVSLVLGREILRLDTFPDRASASTLAEELCAALGLASPSAEAPVEELRDWLSSIPLIALLAPLVVVGAACWGIYSDLPDRVGAPMALAAVVVVLALVVARRLALGVIQSEGAWAASRAHDLPQPAPTRRRLGGVLFALSAAGVLAAAVIAAAAISTPELPSPTAYGWSPDAPRTCGLDVNGDGLPELIATTWSGRGPWSTFDLDALDARTGAHVAQLNRGGALNVPSCEPPFLVFDSSSDDGKKIDIAAYTSLLVSRDSLWRVTVRGKVAEILRSEGCALLRSQEPGQEDVWRSISLSTGEPCASIPEPVSPTAVAAARLAQELQQPPAGRRTVDGVSYTLVASESSSGLTLSASRGDTLLWRTELEVRPIDSLPLAVTQGTLVVAATDLRTGKYLRILGVDAVSGRVRYVRRHPVGAGDPVDLAVVGSMVLLKTARLAGLEPSSGRVAWITQK